MLPLLSVLYLLLCSYWCVSPLVMVGILSWPGRGRSSVCRPGRQTSSSTTRLVLLSVHSQRGHRVHTSSSPTRLGILSVQSQGGHRVHTSIRTTRLGILTLQSQGGHRVHTHQQQANQAGHTICTVTCHRVHTSSSTTRLGILSVQSPR